MKIFGYLFGLAFLLSCKTPCKIKRAASNTEEKTIGIVHVAENNCPFYIEVIKGNKDDLKKKLYPIDFKDNYKKKGLKLSFNFTYSKAMSPENCSVDGVVVINNVDVIP